MYMKCVTNLILDLAPIEDWRKHICTYNFGSFTLIHTNIISYSCGYAVSDMKTSITSFFTDLVEIVKETFPNWRVTTSCASHCPHHGRIQTYLRMGCQTTPCSLLLPGVVHQKGWNEYWPRLFCLSAISFIWKLHQKQMLLTDVQIYNDNILASSHLL
jgi:hypothetical protein